ncbi:hypothetical protein J6590_078641 [Homalodisca vitripennis]|nr:hypothetical protein J6590_078641 [Homalodisca vitripennis]
MGLLLEVPLSHELGLHMFQEFGSEDFGLSLRSRKKELLPSRVDRGWAPLSPSSLRSLRFVGFFNYSTLACKYRPSLACVIPAIERVSPPAQLIKGFISPSSRSQSVAHGLITRGVGTRTKPRNSVISVVEQWTRGCELTRVQLRASQSLVTAANSRVMGSSADEGILGLLPQPLLISEELISNRCNRCLIAPSCVLQ